ncbi:MAG TPA: choice-of-anchor D domain-containing protein [Nitrososphaera sp.]|nr:choice-of-anchor D domain-containing protein [Nitrososphaera sp.]
MRTYIRHFCALHWLLAFTVFLFAAIDGAAASTALASSKTSIRFSSWPVGSSAYQYETLTNKGSSSVKISQVATTGQFAIANLTTPLTLSSGKSVTFIIRFKPTTAGGQTGKLSVTSTASVLTVALSGTATAVGTFSVSPTSYSFGSVTVGQTVAKAATLIANSAPLSISSATTTNPEFTISGIKLPLTLAAGKSVPISINFKPTSSGATSSQIAFATTVGASIKVSASGTGVALQQHKVNLTWTRSSSSVAGYNVYRGIASSGPYTKLNSQTIVATSYTDSSIASGKTYFYVTTAVSSKGAESVKSNEVRAAVPTP